jgi:hypothetical protein
MYKNRLPIRLSVGCSTNSSIPPLLPSSGPIRNYYITTEEQAISLSGLTPTYGLESRNDKLSQAVFNRFHPPEGTRPNRV